MSLPLLLPLPPEVIDWLHAEDDGGAWRLDHQRLRQRHLYLEHVALIEAFRACFGRLPDGVHESELGR